MNLETVLGFILGAIIFSIVGIVLLLQKKEDPETGKVTRPYVAVGIAMVTISVILIAISYITFTSP